MGRSRIFNAAMAGLLFANTGIAAQSTSPPTPIRLVDVQGRPVAGAVVGADFRMIGNGSHPSDPERDRTPDDGRAGRGVADDDVWYRTLRDSGGSRSPAGRCDHGHARQLGKPASIVMHPACRVRLRVECPGFRELEARYHAELGGPNW